MAKITVKGYDEYALRMDRLQNVTKDIGKAVTYAGGKVVADAIKKELKALPIDDRQGTSQTPLNGITGRQKSDLINGFGLAPIENKSGYIQTKAGFAGYGSTPTKSYPKGVPNQMLARSINSGTSFRKKNPFVRRAVNQAKQPAIKAMGKEIDDQCEKIMK